MSSQIDEPSAGAYLLDFPGGGNRLAGLLWPDPVEPGYYGNQWSQTVLLTTNHRPTLRDLAAASGAEKTILALPGGGLSPDSASALGLVTAGQASNWLQSYPGEIKEGRLVTPVSMGRAFGWEHGMRLDRWMVIRSLDGVSDLEAGARPPRGLPPMVRRLTAGSAMWLGQALLFAIPLLVFGWQAMLMGLGALLVCVFLLALAWGVLPGPGWIKGLLAGIVLGCGYAAFATLALGQPWSGLWSPALGCLLGGAWMGSIFSGARS